MSFRKLLLHICLLLALVVLTQSPAYADPAFADNEDDNRDVHIITPVLTDDFAEEDLMEIFPGGPTVNGVQLRLTMPNNIFVEGQAIPFEVTYQNRSVVKIGLIGYRINEIDTSTNRVTKAELRRSETLVDVANSERANGKMAGGKRLLKTSDLSWYGQRVGPEPVKRYVTFIKPGDSIIESGDLIQEYRYQGYKPGLVPGQYSLTIRYRNSKTLGNTWLGEVKSNSLAFTVIEAE